MQPVPLPDGAEAWLIDEKWFDPNPPFLDFFHINSRAGLSTVGGIKIHLQDRNGFLWMSSRDSWGLFRYDGHLFKRFDEDQANTGKYLATKEIECVVEDESGFLWIGCPLGLTRYDPKTEVFRTFENTIDPSGNSVGQVFIDRQSRLWYSTENGTFLFNRKKEQFEKAFSGTITDATDATRRAEGNFKWLFIKAFQTPDGLIWSIGSTPIGKGLVSVNPETGASILYPLKTPFYITNKENPIDYDPWLCAFCPDLNGEYIWLGGWRGSLRRFNLKTRKWTQFAKNYDEHTSVISANLDCIQHIAQRPDGKLWLATAFGTMLFDPEKWRFQSWTNKGQDPAELMGERFTSSMLLDREQRLWMSAIAMAVHDPGRRFFIRAVHKWPGKGSIAGLTYDPMTNKTWFAISNGWVEELDETTGQYKYLGDPKHYKTNNPKHMHVFDITRIGRVLWLVTEPFLIKIDLDSGKRTLLPPFVLPPEQTGKPADPTSLEHIAVAPDGTLWISNVGAKRQVPLLHYFPETGQLQLFDKKNGLTVTQGDRIFIDRRGRVWLSSHHTTDNGVNCYDPQTGKTLVFTPSANTPNSLPHTQVNCFLEDKSGRVWMGTNRGICYFDPSDGLIHRVFSLDAKYTSLVFDQEGYIWAAGSAVIRLNPNTGVFEHYNEEHGMYWTGEKLYVRNDGAVCFGPHYRAFPKQFPQRAAGPRVYLTDFQVFNKKYDTPKAIDLMDKIELKHQDNFFSLSWSSINLTMPAEDSFAYQLQGVDADWTLQSSAAPCRASYTKIAPGNYLFRVKCSNQGVWGPEKILPVIIHPAWYQTLWFKILVAALAAGILYFIWKNRLRQLRLQSEIKQREAEFRQREAEFQQRLTEATMSALRAQMNPHFIFNSLNSINRFIQLSAPDAASNYLTKFSRLIRLVLDNSRQEVISLETELETGRLYLEMESLRFADQFFYSIDVAEDIETSMLEVPPMLIQPYLENAIWHGLMQKTGSDRRLDLQIFMENEQLLVLKITDNGIGRAAAQAMKSKSAMNQKSHGMDVTAERIALFQQTTGRHIHISVEDLLEPDGQAAGTSVRLEMEIG